MRAFEIKAQAVIERVFFGIEKLAEVETAFFQLAQGQGFANGKCRRTGNAQDADTAYSRGGCNCRYGFGDRHADTLNPDYAAICRRRRCVWL